MHLMVGLFENQNNADFDYHAISYTKKKKIILISIKELKNHLITFIM